jgi:hypothetical protein
MLSKLFLCSILELDWTAPKDSIAIDIEINVFRFIKLS